MADHIETEDDGGGKHAQVPNAHSADIVNAVQTVETDTRACDFVTNKQQQHWTVAF